MQPHSAITYILAPIKRLQPPAPTPPKAAARPLSKLPGARLQAPAPIETAPVAPPQPQAITQPIAPPPDPFAEPPVKPTEDLRQRALNSAALVDKQLRKEAWNPRDKKIANDTTVLAAKIGGAYVGNSGTTMEEVTTSDGRLMTKVRTPGGGTYCAYKENNALTGGRDPFRDGVKTKVTSCP